LREEPSKTDERKSNEINRREQEVTSAFEAEELEGETLRSGPRDQLRDWPLGGQPQVFLKRWRRRSAFRRIKLVQELLLTPLGPRRLKKLEMMLRTLEGRKAWLEARLAHAIGLESIVQAAIQRQSRNHRGDRQNEFRENGRREGSIQGGGQP